MHDAIITQSIAQVITQPGGWLIPVALVTGALGGYTFTVKRTLDRVRAQRPANVVDLQEARDRMRRAELDVAMAFGQKEATL